ncbi:DbpA RNA binding domain-containing protein [Treponema saccharophilum]|uniref:DbpA RNA-binding domain protein n=1 Tax=Treponema saccharophilum DSM 2985 TaxID=907348 RepID=H7EMX6_9SPIR|nr:DbpA RNA binding domain-containing protein [Treponema saccharophilum]EIC01040.1 DbpA RNA-binding domain protein [Treponema saccharophilum DSM 2985]BDC95352.1 hypothetical protein TRSA_04510 [Treponema saccharophilum]
MAFRREDVTVEQVASFLQDAVAKVKSNPEEFEDLKKVFKQNVPLTMRSFVAAYVLKQASGAIYRFNNFKNRDDFRPRRKFERDHERADEGAEQQFEQREVRERHERYQHINIEPDMAATVFVGVGRNRRVFPRDIVGLFISVAGIEKERIGDIKVLANYSFVQLFKDDAEKAISALNGYDYRGRKLSVSFSRQKDIDADIGSDEQAEEPRQERFPRADDVREEPKFSEPEVSVSAQEPAAEEKFDEEPQVTVVKSYSEMTDEEILAMRAPKSSSSSDIE